MNSIFYKQKAVGLIVAALLIITLLLILFKGSSAGDEKGIWGRFRRSGEIECNCGPGKYVKTKCTSTQHAVCEPCAVGAYSSGTNKDSYCTDCTHVHCPSQAFFKSKCTPEADSVCECNEGYKQKQVISDKLGFSCSKMEADEGTTTEANKENSQCNVLPDKTVVLMMSLVALVFFHVLMETSTIV